MVLAVGADLVPLAEPAVREFTSAAMDTFGDIGPQVHVVVFPVAPRRRGTEAHELS